MLLAKQRRPDIANAVRSVSRNANKPRVVHWKTSIGISECVFSTIDFGITFHKANGLELVAFEYADYASKATARRSVSGGAILSVGACVLVFEDAELCYALDHRGRVCSTGRHH